MIEPSVRIRAALCHLALFSGVGIVVVPFVLGKLTADLTLFESAHRRGAILYQLLGVSSFGVLAMISGFGSDYTNDFTAGALLTFFWVVYLCALGVYFLGAFWLTVQAWSGTPFKLGLIDRWVYAGLPVDSEKTDG